MSRLQKRFTRQIEKKHVKENKRQINYINQHMEFFYGFHESTKGGIPKAIDRVIDSGCNSTQIFLGTPYVTNPSAIKLTDSETTRHKLSNLENQFKLFVHGPYTVNFAKPPNQTKWQQKLIQYLCKGADDHGADGVIFHMGKHTKLSEEQGLHNMKESIRQTVSHRDFRGRLILETAAGQGTELCWRWESFADLYRSLESEHDKLGVCLDTCHLFAAGHELNAQVLDKMAKDLGGAHHIRLIHLNDSKGPLGCRKDRHHKLGEGHMGSEVLHEIIRWGKEHQVPLILETKPPWQPQLEFIRKNI